MEAQVNRITRLPEVQAITGLSRSTIYARVEDGLFPKPVQIGPQSVGWPINEVSAINEARIRGRTDDEIRQIVIDLETARTGMAASPRRKAQRAFAMQAGSMVA
jgi:prophage regulatory protein